jgi:hypothetical protein
MPLGNECSDESLQARLELAACQCSSNARIVERRLHSAADRTLALISESRVLLARAEDLLRSPRR